MKERIGLDFFTKVFFPSHLEAKDGTFYFIGKRANMDKNCYDSDLYCLRDGKPVRLTCSHDVSDYAIIDDGIIFAATREQKDKEAQKNGEPLTVFQRLPFDGGEACEHLRLPYVVTQPEWLPDGRLLFRGIHDHLLEKFLVEHEGDMEKALKDKKEQDESVTCVEELPFWFNGMGFVNKRRTAVYLYDGKETKILTGLHANAGDLVLNAERSQALFTQEVYENVRPMNNTLMLCDTKTGEVREVEGIPEGAVEAYTFGPDGMVYFLFTSPENPRGMIITNPWLCRVPLAGGKMEVLDDGGRYDYYSSVGSDVKLGGHDNGPTAEPGGISFLCTLINDSHILRYDIEKGAFSQITKEKGAVSEHIPYGDGYAMIAMRGDGLSDIYTVTKDGAETKVSDFNAKLMDKYEVVTPIELSFTNKEGTEIYGWVMPPVGYVPGMVYPAILNIHGGPKTVYGSVFFHEMQYWCAQGFAVLFCNPTGGDGRGDAFADIRGKYGTVDYDDIMQFVDEAQARFGFISTVRIGVTGGSYGGFMTNWIIGHTDRFRAAASQRSIANWLGFNNTSDIGYYFGEDQMQGTPWNAAEKLWKASPLKYADKVKTPTLFIHSEEDYRCNMFEGIQMFYALRSLGVETRLCLFKGENHELSRSGKPKNRIRRLQEITRWMEKHLTALD